MPGVRIANNMSDDHSDMTAARQVRDGDVDAFRYFLDRYGHYVRCVVARHVRPAAVAEVVQEAFVRAYESVGSYDEARPFRNWMTSIALRTCHDHLRREYRDRERTMDTLDGQGLEWLERAAGPEAERVFLEEESGREAVEVLQWAMRRIIPLDRMVLTLTYLEGMTMAEAADMLGLSEVNVRVRAFRARRRLRRIIGEEEGWS